MKIIKSGKSKKPKQYITKCNCGCKFSFEESEARFSSDRGETAFIIACPECLVDNWIDSSILK